jgi:hypothetical protein
MLVATGEVSLATSSPSFRLPPVDVSSFLRLFALVLGGYASDIYQPVTA